MTTAVMAPTAPMREAWEAARERREARRNVYQSYTEAEELRARLEGRTLERVSIMAPQFRGPSTAAEFFDDRILERNSSFWGLRETPVLIEVAAAAREGAEAAVRAVKAARQLDRPAQWVVCQSITAWGRGDAAKTGADQAVNAVLREWSRLRLQQGDPDDD